MQAARKARTSLSCLRNEKVRGSNPLSSTAPAGQGRVRHPTPGGRRGNSAVIEAENRVAGAKAEARERLEQDVESARRRTQETADRMRQRTEQVKQQADLRVGDFQRSWNEHVERVRTRIDARKAQHDAKVPKHDAKAAADYAEFAIDFAYSAIEEAEYAVLDAVLASMDVDAVDGATDNSTTATRSPDPRCPARDWRPPLGHVS